jgi:protein SCO1/2
MQRRSTCPPPTVKQGRRTPLAGLCSRRIPGRSQGKIIDLSYRRLRPFSLIILILAFLCLLSLPGARGHALDNSQPLGIAEGIGQTIPAGISFADEQGTVSALRDLIRKPTILVLIYYTCDRLCPQMLAGLAAALPHVGLTADKDYQVITVSFDETDTPALARDLKRNYLKAIGRPFPQDAWRFLTGDRQNIQALCSAAGFTFWKEHEGFSHPVALIILSSDRKITQYIHVSKFSYGVAYPITFSATILSRALTNASRGEISLTPKSGFLYCFPHEPKEQERFFHILMLIGGGTVIGLALFFVYLSLSGRKPREGKRS